MESGSKPKDCQFPPWLGSRLHSLAQLEPTVRLDNGRRLLLRVLRSDRMPSLRLLSGFVVDREADDGLVSVVHEWHSTRTRGSGALGRNPYCGFAEYLLRGEELVHMRPSDDAHASSTLYTATTEAGRLNELRASVFDPFVTDRARRAAEEVVSEHVFVSPDITAGLGHLGLQVAPAHA